MGRSIGTAAASLADGGHDAGAGPVLGYLAALGSAVCMAVCTLGVGGRRGDVADLLLPATIVGVAASGVLVLVTGAEPPGPDGIAVAAFIGLGPMAAGYGLWTRAMAGDGAARLARSATRPRCSPPCCSSRPAPRSRPPR